MQKKFITNLALLLLLNLLIKPFWILGIDRAVQNAVLPGDYGLYYALFNFSFLLNILLDFGITNFNNKNIAQNNHLLSKHLSSIVFLRIILGGLYMFGSLAFAALIGYRGYNLLLVAVMGANQFLASFILYLRSNLAGLHLFKTDSVISVLDRLIMILFCALLLWGGVSSPSNPFKIEWYIYCQTAAYVLTVIITLLLVFNKAKIRKITWRPAFFLVILKKSYPYAILVLLMTFYNRIDAVMLERILADGEIQSSIYASAYRLLDAANMIAYLFAGLLLPIFARMIKLRHRLEDLVKLSFSLLIVLSFTAATGTWFFSKDLTEMLYTHHTGASAQVLQLLMCCFVFVSTTYVFGTLLTANGNLRELNIMAFSGMLLNIGLNFVLIPHYKAAGSAASSLITQGLTAIAQVILAARVFKFKTDYIYLFRIALFCLFTAAAGYFISVKLPSQGALSALLILGAGAPIVALATGVISIPGLLKAIREDV